MSTFDWEDLRSHAVAAAARAYAPYSRYHVGAAAVADDGRVLTGCNVENAAYGVALCAECGLVSDLVAGGGGRLVAFTWNIKTVEGRDRVDPAGDASCQYRPPASRSYRASVRLAPESGSPSGPMLRLAMTCSASRSSSPASARSICRENSKLIANNAKASATRMAAAAPSIRRQRSEPEFMGCRWACRIRSGIRSRAG